MISDHPSYTMVPFDTQEVWVSTCKSNQSNAFGPSSLYQCLSRLDRSSLCKVPQFNLAIRSNQMKISLLQLSNHWSEPSHEVGPTATRSANRVADPATRVTYWVPSSELYSSAIIFQYLARVADPATRLSSKMLNWEFTVPFCWILHVGDKELFRSG